MKVIPLHLVRELHFTIKGEAKTGKLTIEKLVFSSERKKWACHWSLEHLYDEAVSFTGDDPLQALTRTLDFASSLMRGHEADGVKVQWQFEGDHGGLTFPMCEEKDWDKD